jgi:hypothetical protein
MRLRMGIAAMVIATGCGDEPTGVCSLVGYANPGLGVHLAQMPSEPFRIEVRSTAGTAIAVVYECTVLSTCVQDVWFGLFAPRIPEYHITVRTASASAVTEVHDVVFAESEPNGVGCGKRYEAKVTVAVP